MIAVSDIFLLVVSIITMNAVIDCDSLEEKELLTLPEHRSSSRYLVGFVLLDLEFYVYVW
jgi:hypothetical protein